MFPNTFSLSILAQGGWSSDKSTSKAPSSVKMDSKVSASVHPYATTNRPNSRTGP